MAPTPGPVRLLGALLAGGRSTRFGSPKWRAEAAGLSLGARGVAALSAHCERVVAISGDEGLEALGVEVLPDLEPDRGPLEGVRTALHHARAAGLEGALVLACDLPLADAAVLGVLAGLWQGEEALVPRGARGPEPLCAVYSVHALGRVEGALAEGERSPARLLTCLATLHLGPERFAAAAGGADPFLNANTPGALAEAEALLLRRSRADTGP